MESIDYQLLLAFGSGVAMLLLLILFFRVNAFISLLIASITVGLLAGISFDQILKLVIEGMGNTLGFVAIVVGLGSIFGAILQKSGATEILSTRILKVFGIKKAPVALSISGFLIAIPVFFDVAFVILVPLIYSLQKETKKSLLLFAIPLLSSLAVTHAFIPPTPGPIAVADIMNADLGWIIFYGFMVGIPTTIVSGLIFGRYISKKIYVESPALEVNEKNYELEGKPLFGIILFLIALPIFLILLNTVSGVIYEGTENLTIEIIQFLGHPIIALIITVLLALYLLGTRLGFSKSELQEISAKSLGPAGIIILITGAGGVFKQMLVETGAGTMLAEQFARLEITPIIMAFLIALIVRLVQGSATVAMITAAGIMAPILQEMSMSPGGLALIVLSIAAGASGFSHVNDSGFWLVNRYLGMTETSTLKSWTMMTGILSITALVIILVLSLFVA